MKTFLIVILLGSMPMTSGCSVVMAIRQETKKDLGVLAPGTNRVIVRDALGIKPEQTPMTRSVGKDCTEETYPFVQGFPLWLIAIRATVHTAGDVFTCFLWEVAGIPIELFWTGDKMVAVVTYDQDNRLVSAQLMDNKGKLVLEIPLKTEATALSRENLR